MSNEVFLKLQRGQKKKKMMMMMMMMYKGVTTMKEIDRSEHREMQGDNKRPPHS